MAQQEHYGIAQKLWDAIAAGDAGALGEVLARKTVWRMRGRNPFAGTHVGVEAVCKFLAHVGERADELDAELIDIFTSERGAVIRYAFHAQRGTRRLYAEHLLMTRIENGHITEAVFAPFDQEAYDRFWVDA